MAQFTVPILADVTDSDARQTLEGIQSKLGMLPNLYAFEAHAPQAFLSNLAFAQALESGSFSNRQVQAIYLAVSEVNDCSYCLSAHTALAKMNGFSEEETFDLRTGTIADPMLRTLTQLTRSFVETKGRPDAALLDAFFAAGFDQTAFVELVGLISVKTLSNYIHNAAQFPVDFPLAKPVPVLV
ncbi:MAG: carboxymuconolactone decarboxylase family protein [Bacteroidota bacterium]